MPKEGQRSHGHARGRRGSTSHSDSTLSQSHCISEIVHDERDERKKKKETQSVRFGDSSQSRKGEWRGSNRDSYPRYERDRPRAGKEHFTKE